MTKKKPESEKKKRGRKSLYDPTKHPQQILILAEQGYTNDQIAEALNISVETLKGWIKKYPELIPPIKEGKDKADGEIETSLFNRAKGMKVKEITVIQNPDGSTRKEIKEKEIPPDTAAAFIWLKNRKPKQWRDKQEMQLTGKDGMPLIPAKEIPDEEVEARARAILTKRK